MKSNNSKGPIPIYPWDVWLRLGTSRTLRKGKDFTCSLRSMTVYLYHNAKRRGVRVKVLDAGDGALQIIVHDGKPARRKRSA